MAQRREITNYNLSQNRTLNYEYYSSKTKTEKPISNVYNIYLNKEKMNKGLNKIPNCNSVSKGKKKYHYIIIRFTVLGKYKKEQIINYYTRRGKSINL